MFVCPKCGEAFREGKGLFWHFIGSKPCARYAIEKGGGTAPCRHERPGKAPLQLPDEGSGIQAGPLIAMLLAGILLAVALAWATLYL